MVIVVAGLGKAAGSVMNPTNAAVLFLLPVILSAMWLGRGPSIFASVLGVLSLDFFFVPPFYTLTVHDLDYLLSFFIFLVVALVISALAERLRMQVAMTKEREANTRALYDLSREMAAEADFQALVQKILDQMERTMHAKAVLLMPEAEGRLSSLGRDNEHSLAAFTEKEKQAAEQAYRLNCETGRGTMNAAEASGYYLPLSLGESRIAVLGIIPREYDEADVPKRKMLMRAMADLAGLAITRLQLSVDTQRLRNIEESERLRMALLNSVAHDIRTPLSSIIGAVTSLMEEPHLYSDEQKMELLGNIRGGAMRLHRMSSNLLNMVRVESQPMRLGLDWCDIQDIIGVAIRQVRDMGTRRRVEVVVEEDMPVVMADFALLEQVVINLLENADKYSYEDAPVEIRVGAADGALQVAVRDRGPGLAPEEKEKVFEKFYRGAVQRSASGTGLGLYICRGIIEAHRGDIWMEDRPGGGSIFAFSLPLAGPRAAGDLSEVSQHGG